MKYTKYETENYDIYLLNTNRFKTIEIKINIRIKNEKENDKYIPMLKRMLLNTSSKYETIKKINEKCASIYDPYYLVDLYKSGYEQIISLTGIFTNEKYTENGMNEENVKFLTHFLFKPKIINNRFDEKVFEIQKSKLIEYYSSLKDHPRNYADVRIDEEMKILDYKSYKLDEIIKITKSLTSEELYEFYKKIMANGKLDVFVCGNINSNIKNTIQKYIKFNGNNIKNINHIVKQKNYNIKPNIVIENSLNVQSNLIIGCKITDIDEFERKYVFVLYSWILGGGMNSLLNKTVREKNSLCYYIYAIKRNVDGILKIYAGINKEDFDKTYKLIQEEMDNMKKGNIPDEIIDGVKNIYYNSLISIEDYQDDMVNSFISEIYTNNDDIKVRKKEIEKVTKDDIVKFASKVHIDTVYLLKGDAK